MSEGPALPAGLQLEQRDRADSARAEALRLVRAGAAEGTLVRVLQPADVRGRHDAPWQISGDPGLHAALILRPGLPAAECAELAPVTLIALARAVGAIVEPMTELHYGWPNDLLLNYGKAAAVWLDGIGTPGSVDALVVSWALNVATAPAALGHAAAAVAREGACEPPAPDELLQAIARELVAAIARWDEEGSAPVLASWRARVPTGVERHLRLADGSEVAGVAESVTDTGDLVLRAEDGTRTSVSLDAFFGVARSG